MQLASRSGAPLVPGANAVSQINALITTLQRSVLRLEIDIQSEEERTKAFDRADPAYPALARHLRARRDNIVATIATLESQLIRFGTGASRDGLPE
jgi:hypothetical protein